MNTGLLYQKLEDPGFVTISVNRRPSSLWRKSLSRKNLRVIAKAARSCPRRAIGEFEPSARPVMHGKGARALSGAPRRRKKVVTTPATGLAAGAACQGQNASASPGPN